MLRLTELGLYCEAGDFHIDPWRPVERAVVTHAHGDHLTWGCRNYLVASDGAAIARERLGSWGRALDHQPYGAVRTVNGVRVSFHPAGHILGSAQIRLEHRGEVWVVSGDYKTDADPTCTPWEPVRCHTFITESTFGLPIYQWPSPTASAAQINAWWERNAGDGAVSVLCGYALGKAQRLLAMLDPSIGPIFTHGAVERMTALYRDAGIALPPTGHAPVGERTNRTIFDRAIVLAPPAVTGTSWLRRFGETRVAFASGWMRVRGARRRRGVDMGFVVSDHVDWPQLLRAIDATEASRVWVTHGFTGAVSRWLEARGIETHVIPTRWEGEREEEREEAAEAPDVAAAEESPKG